MTDSLRDQLLKLGFTPPAKEPPKPDRIRQESVTRAMPGDGRHKREKSQRSRHGQDRARGDQSCEPGFVASNRAARDEPPHSQRHKSQNSKPQSARTQAEIDLGKAYALRAQIEKDERIDTERQKQEAARIKREAKAKVTELLKDNTLNDATAELVRHFDYNGKIKRIHVNADQLKALNAGELGVVQLDGRYLLVTADHARQTQALLPSVLALLVDPDAPVADDPYADPAYRVPDDLVW